MDAIAQELLQICRTARLATTGSDGAPHVVPVWFVWHSDRMYIQSVESSLKTRHARRVTRAAAVVDEGQQTARIKDGRLELEHLRGVELRGALSIVTEDPQLKDVARRWAERYVTNGPTDGILTNHVWLRLEPDSIRSWDYGTR